MTNRGSFATGMGVGVALSYFLDPSCGTRRRARVRDMTVHAATVTRRGMSKSGRDAWHRAYGTAASLRSITRRRRVDDEVLAERVRATLGRVVSHSHAINVMASSGTVRLKGPVLDRESRRLIRAVSRIHGVREVVDQLERHEEAGDIPALQGGTPTRGHRPDVLQANWAPATRAVIGTAGTALIAIGLRRRDVLGSAAALAGFALFARATANIPMRQFVGVAPARMAVDVQKTITINAPVGEVYGFWSLYENFPRFMSRVLEVRSSDADPMRSHWKVTGLAGAPIEFDARVTRAVPNQLIEWQTLEEAPVAHRGTVRFDQEKDGRTRVHIRMAYTPPAGWFGHGIAAAFGVDPKHSMDADLVRMKTLIETGHAPHDAAYRQP